jgi:hypothetical protein
MRIVAQLFDHFGISYLPPLPASSDSICCSRAVPVLLWEAQAPLDAKGIFFFFDKSPFIITPNLM